MKPAAAATIGLVSLVLAVRAPSPAGPGSVSGPHAPPMAGTPSAATHRGVVGGPHDFSGPRGGLADACRTCHVPHVQGIRATTQPATRPALDTYRIPGQRKAFVPGRFTPGPTSLICLGCHDGTVATSVLNTTHAMLAGEREGFGAPAREIWRDHPIGVPYPSGRSHDYRPVELLRNSGVPLPEGRIECISCHEPHNRTGLAGMLVMSNRRSALCLTCHVK